MPPPATSWTQNLTSSTVQNKDEISEDEDTRVQLDKEKATLPCIQIQEYVASASEISLRNSLHTFRRTQTTATYGWATLADMGPGVIMSDAILQRIIDGAHEYKIDSVASLAEETQWLNAQAYGSEVISLINLHCPKPVSAPLLVPTPLVD